MSEEDHMVEMALARVDRNGGMSTSEDKELDHRYFLTILPFRVCVYVW